MTKSVEKAQCIRVAEQFETSGQTQRAFAQQQALPLSTLQSWVYRHRRQEAGAQASAVRLLPVELSSVPPEKPRAGWRCAPGAGRG